MLSRASTHRVAIAVVLACCVSLGCRDREPARHPRDDTTVGLPRAQAMIDEAARCHAAPAVDAADACRRGCELGHSNSCARAGDAARSGGDRDAALRWYDRACQGGSGLGCDRAAELTETTDPEAAARYLVGAKHYHRVHCEQGYVPSCLGLANMYERGRGVPQRDDLARFYQRMAQDLSPQTPE